MKPDETNCHDEGARRIWRQPTPDQLAQAGYTVDLPSPSNARDFVP
jgi:hypothetical protein